MIIGYSIQPETTRGKKKHEKPEAKSNNCPIKAKKPRSQEAEKTKGAKATKPQKPQKSQEPQKPRSQTENKKTWYKNLPSFLPSLLPSFLPSFLPFILPSFFPVLFNILIYFWSSNGSFTPLSPTRLYVKKYVKVQVKYFGWWFQPLWKILVNGKDYPIHYGK